MKITENENYLNSRIVLCWIDGDVKNKRYSLQIIALRFCMHPYPQGYRRVADGDTIKEC